MSYFKLAVGYVDCVSLGESEVSCSTRDLSGLAHKHAHIHMTDETLTAIANLGAGGAGVELALNRLSDYSWINDLLGVGAGTTNEEILVITLLGASLVALLASTRWISNMTQEDS